MNVRRFEARLRELEKSLSARTGRALSDAREQFIDSAHDLGDAGSADVAADDAFTEAELDATTLTQVRDALDRIAKGTYGKCLADGTPIEEKRLEAVPWAGYCARHQALIEGSDEPQS